MNDTPNDTTAPVLDESRVREIVREEIAIAADKAAADLAADLDGQFAR